MTMSPPAPEQGRALPTQRLELLELMDFLLLACRALLECGCSANRVELLCDKIASSYGFQVDVIALPTGVWVACRRGDERLTELTRVRRWTVDLQRLSLIDDLVKSIEAHAVTFGQATSRLRDLAVAKPPYPIGVTILAGCGASAGLVYLLGGSPTELALTAPLGGMVEALNFYVFVSDHRRYLADFLCAAIVTFYVCLCHAALPALDTSRMVISGLIALVPGLTLVNAIHEIAQKNLVSGTAKLVEAAVIGMSLAFGVALAFGAFIYFR